MELINLSSEPLGKLHSWVPRDLDTCLALIEGYVEEVARFGVIGYMGHL